MLFWENVTSLISGMNLTQDKVARSIPVRADTFSRWKQRGTMPKADQAVAIAKSLNTTVEYMVTGTIIEESPVINQLKNFLDSLPRNELEQSFRILKAVFPRRWENTRDGLL